MVFYLLLEIITANLSSKDDLPTPIFFKYKLMLIFKFIVMYLSFQ